MAQYIDKAVLVTEIERIKKSISSDRFLNEFEKGCNQGKEDICDDLLSFLDTIVEKDVAKEKQQLIDKACEQLTAFAVHLDKRGAFRDDLCMDFEHEAQSFIELQKH